MINKKVILIALTSILAFLALMIYILRSDYSIISRCFEIDLPGNTKIVKMERIDNGGVAAHILINESDVDSFIKSVEDSGYSTINIHETLEESEIISWWDLNKNEVSECYYDNKHRNLSIFKAIPGVDLFIYIVNSDDESVSVYLFG